MSPYTKQEKLEWLAEWKACGGSANTFAQDKPFSPSSLQYWKRKFKTTTESSSFIEIIPDQTKVTPYAKVTYPSGMILEIFTPVPSDYFKRLLK